MHMLWAGSVIYLKPLPDFLLSHSVWQKFLCQNASLMESALGLLQSYVWLIMHSSDHRIAVKHGLLDERITWKSGVCL
jgi:hypothetical protein